MIYRQCQFKCPDKCLNFEPGPKHIGLYQVQQSIMDPSSNEEINNHNHCKNINYFNDFIFIERMTRQNNAKIIAIFDRNATKKYR